MERAPHSVTASAIGLLSLSTRYHIPRGSLLFLLRKFAASKRIGCNHELRIKVGAEYASVTRHSSRTTRSEYSNIAIDIVFPALRHLIEARNYDDFNFNFKIANHD